MNPPLNSKAWQLSWVAAFWDRPGLTYEKWHECILIDDAKGKKMLLQSLLHMGNRHFIELVGLQVFIEHYPEWRELFPNDSRDAIIKK